MKHARGLRITAAIIGAFAVLIVILIVIVSMAESGPEDYRVTKDGGNSDWSTITVPSAYSADEYQAIIDDAQKDHWDADGGYYVRITCEADGTVLAKARGAVGTEASAQTGVDDGEWKIEDTDATC